MYKTYLAWSETFYARPDIHPLLQVQAEDQDLGYNGALVYVISDGDQDAVFQINMTSGVVSIMSMLDREKTQDYMLNITACDQGAPQKCTSILSHVIVLDQNDNSPVFMKSAFSFFLLRPDF